MKKISWHYYDRLKSEGVERSWAEDKVKGSMENTEPGGCEKREKLVDTAPD